MSSKIETGTIYAHPEYGEVLVEAVIAAHDSWCVGEGVDDQGRVAVRFYREFDDYGGMPPAHTESVETFAEKVKELRAHEYVSPDGSD